ENCGIGFGARAMALTGVGGGAATGPSAGGALPPHATVSNADTARATVVRDIGVKTRSAAEISTIAEIPAIRAAGLCRRNLGLKRRTAPGTRTGARAWRGREGDVC